MIRLLGVPVTLNPAVLWRRARKPDPFERLRQLIEGHRCRHVTSVESEGGRHCANCGAPLP